MKRENPNIYLLIFIVLLVFSMMAILAYGEGEQRKFPLSARSATLYQPETKNFLFMKNANQRLPMASTTKIMTALVAIENSDFNESVLIESNSVGIEGSSAYLKEGDVLSMEELLYALLLQSANDAATAIAYYIGGSIEGFADIMNERARTLGLTDTHFTNPHGLDNPEHYTTAKELAIIAGEAMKNDLFRKIVSTDRRIFATEERSRTYINHNKLLRLYDGCIGVKTGFTKKSGRCLVSAAEKDGLLFISVTLDAPNDWNDHSALLDFGYDKLEKIHLAEANDHIYTIPIIDGCRDRITVANTDGAEIITERTKHDINEYIKLTRYAVAPINQGDILGEIVYTVDGDEVARVKLIATESVNKTKDKNLFDKILSIFNK